MHMHVGREHWQPTCSLCTWSGLQLVARRMRWGSATCALRLSHMCGCRYHCGRQQPSEAAARGCGGQLHIHGTQPPGGPCRAAWAAPAGHARAGHCCVKLRQAGARSVAGVLSSLRAFACLTASGHGIKPQRLTTLLISACSRPKLESSCGSQACQATVMGCRQHVGPA